MPSHGQALVEFLMQQGELNRSFNTPSHKFSWGQVSWPQLLSKYVMLVVPWSHYQCRLLKVQLSMGGGGVGG